MKLLLASSGFTNDEIIAACEELMGKPRQEINFAIINEAVKVEAGDHHWLIEGLEEIAHNFGGNIEFVDLQAHPMPYVKERLDECDVVFCFGGNTDYLTKVFLETGFTELLPRLLKEKVWVGSSAGSCVLCHKESKDTTKNVFMEKPFTDSYLNIVPIFFLPHFHNEWFPRLNESVAMHESELSDFPVYLMSDQSAVVITGEPGNLEFRPVGSDYHVFKNGEEM